MKVEFPERSRIPVRSAWLAGILVASFAAGCDAFMSADDRIERGQAALEAGDYAAAMTDIRTALAEEPENTAGRILLARVMLKMGDAAIARKEFDRAIAAGADPEAMRNLHYDILAGEGRHDDIIIAAAVDEALEPQRKLRLIAAAQSAIGQHDKALVTIGEALARDAGDADAALIKAKSQWGAGLQQESLKTLDELLTKQPDHARASMYRGRFALSLGDPGDAKKAFLQARASSSTQLDLNEQMAIAAGLVEAHIGSGDMAAAASELAGLEAQAPNSFLTQYLKGRLAFARGDYEAATAELQRALAASPEMPFAQLLLGASLLQTGAVEQADAELSRLLANDPTNSEARSLLARVFLARSDEAGARRILADAPAGSTLSSGTTRLASAVLLRSGQAAEAIELLEDSAAADPGNAELRMDLARAYLSGGRPREAIDTLAALPADAGGSKRRQLMVLAAVSGQKPEEATRRVERLIADQPGESEILVTAGAYFLSIGDNKRAGDVYRQAQKLAPANADAMLGIAAVEVRAGNAAEAEKTLRTVIERHPAVEQGYLALSDLAILRRDSESARRWLEQAVGANPSVIESRLRLAELSLENRDVAKADSLVAQVLSIARQKAPALNRIGGMYLHIGQYERALQHFLDAVAQGAQGARIGAARALLALGRNDEARSQLEAEARGRPAAVEPAAMLVLLDIREKRYESALARVAALEKSGAPPGEVVELRGDIQMASRDHARAAVSYAAAARSRPTSSLAIKEFQARLAARMKSPESALVQWLESHPNSNVVRMILAGHYRKTGRNPDAIAQYERATQFGPNADALNNLAWIYHETGDARALETAKRAYELAPGSAAIGDTYGWVLVEKGSMADGLRILASAAKAAPGHPDIQFHYAAALARNGKPADAATILGRVLTPGTKFASRADAEALMKQLKQE